jgi:hypothetical protein
MRVDMSDFSGVSGGLSDAPGAFVIETTFGGACDRQRARRFA